MSWSSKHHPRTTDIVFYLVMEDGLKMALGLFGGADCTSSCWSLYSDYFQKAITSSLICKCVRKHLNIATGGHVANSTKDFVSRHGQVLFYPGDRKEQNTGRTGQRTSSQDGYKRGIVCNRIYMCIYGHHLRKSESSAIYSYFEGDTS